MICVRFGGSFPSYHATSRCKSAILSSQQECYFTPYLLYNKTFKPEGAYFPSNKYIPVSFIFSLIAFVLALLFTG